MAIEEKDDQQLAELIGDLVTKIIEEKALIAKLVKERSISFLVPVCTDYLLSMKAKD